MQTFRLLKIARIVKALRVIRVFKLARHSVGLKALGKTMSANVKELGLLFLLLFIGAIMFASLAFVFEKDDPNTSFRTIFDAYWWAIVTMTTVRWTIDSCILLFLQVGYGDVTPVTGMGQLLGCLCAIFGVTHLIFIIQSPIVMHSNIFRWSS